MSRSTPIPFFPSPPQQYDQAYFSQLVRNFSVFAQQTQVPGPLRATSLSLTTEPGNVDTGILSYNILEDTLDLQHLNGVVQQIGFETFMLCKNNTASLIPNGTVVGFAGVGSNIQVAPYVANDTANELYFIGVTTFDMDPGVVGPVTLYGTLRDIDTTGGLENWAEGDILYASPTTPGTLTNVRPTAPNTVIVVAAVLVVDGAEGEIMVRPTVPMGLDYGTFDSTNDQTPSTINTATAITLDNTLTSNGVSRGTPTSRMVVSQSGFYRIDANLQLTSGSSSSKDVYFWIRKNGVDVADSTRVLTVDTNGGFVPVALSYNISLVASDYVELYWAANDTNVTLDAIPTLSFAPSAPSVLVTVTQTQL